MCGEKTKGTLYFGDHYGSPPRMRGKEVDCLRFVCGLGITPAYAGKSFGDTLFCFQLWDHPRVCGEKVPLILICGTV